VATGGLFEKLLEREKACIFEYLKGILIETKETKGVFELGGYYQEYLKSQALTRVVVLSGQVSADMHYCCLALRRDGYLGLYARDGGFLSW